MRTKSAYVLIMAAAERKLSQWPPLELQAGPLMMDLSPHCTATGNRGWEDSRRTREKKGKRLPSWLAAKPGLGHLALLLDPGPSPLKATLWALNHRGDRREFSTKEPLPVCGSPCGLCAP